MKNLKLTLLIVFIFSVLSLILFGLLELFVEPKITDYYTKLFAKPDNENIAIVMIDEKSIRKIRWPWKRKLYADMCEYIQKHGQAKVIAFDMLLYSPDEKESDEYFYSKLKDCDICIGAFNTDRFLPTDSRMNNEELNILKNKNDIKIKYEQPQQFTQYKDIYKITQGYLNSVNSFGFITTPFDATDGVYRNAYPVLKIKDTSYPMLALSAYAKYKNINSFVVKKEYLCSDDNCKTLKIKINNKSGYDPYMRLKWYQKRDEMTSHKTYSAIDVLESLDAIKNGKQPILDPNIFKDKIIIIAAAAKIKSLEDIKTTPLIENMHAGADIQATAISNFLDNKVMNAYTLKQKFGIAILVTLIAVWLMSFGVQASLVSLSVLAIGYFLYATIMFILGNIIQIITPIVLILMVISGGFIFKFLIEGRKKEQIQNAMGLYISKDIMKNVVKNIDNLQRGGKRAYITVLFADIRGFTSISEKLSADEVTEILNEYFSAVEPIIRKHNGVLNKFIGDAVLAIFGEPIQDKNHAQNAVLCADEINKKMLELQKKWDEEGKPHIEIGIAINTGDAFVGNIGSPERIEYTVIGDTVNTASRIESYNRVYKTRFLISETTYEKVSRICDVIKIREVPIRGKSKKINLYEVLRIIEKNDNQ